MISSISSSFLTDSNLIDCDRDNSSCSFIDYDKAWLEANSDDSQQNLAMDQYIEQIFIKHEEDKQAALEKQYEKFERYIQELTYNLQTPSTSITSNDLSVCGSSTPSQQFPFVSSNLRITDKSKFFKWTQKREELFKEGLNKLKTKIIKTSALTREANLITEELWIEQKTKRGLARYDVTLQIPAANLRPSKIKAENFVCEPVIVVKWSGMTGYQLWSIERLENKLVDLRELYNEKILQKLNILSDSSSSSGIDCNNEDENFIDLNIDKERKNKKWNCQSPINIFSTLFESQEKHTLIGVANIFLEVLFHNSKLDYYVPIISQHGEVCGKLYIEVYRVTDNLLNDDKNNTENFTSNKLHKNNAFLGRQITCRVQIKEAKNLPVNLSHYVFCQYSFFNNSDIFVVPPTQNITYNNTDNQVKIEHNNFNNQEQSPIFSSQTLFKFDHTKDFTVVVTEEFLEYVQDDALSIEVWGHQISEIDNYENVSVEKNEVKNLTTQNFTSSLSKLFSFGSKILTTNNCHNNNDTNLQNNQSTHKKLSLKRKTSVSDINVVAALKQKSLQERWAEVTKRVELWIEILEMNDNGEYINVNVVPYSTNAVFLENQKRLNLLNKFNNVSTGGIYQLKQVIYILFFLYIYFSFLGSTTSFKSFYKGY